MTTETSKRSASFRARLVASLQQAGWLPSASVARAFATIPREVFVPWYYRPKDNPRVWERVDLLNMPAEERMHRVYDDQPLVTRLDAEGFSCSSSSMPSVMARMLEALSVRPGQRVLEIGTGTGYNAALLATLTGQPQLVTTVELDASLAEAARAALLAVVGAGVHVAVTDGRAGCAADAPYDRIIVTASHPQLTRAWYEQLAPGGRLVMDLRGELGGGFLVLDKQGKGEQATGHFLLPAIHFMPLIVPERPPRLRSYDALLEQPCLEEVSLTEQEFSPDLLRDPRFGFFLQWRFPDHRAQRVTYSRQQKRVTTLSFIDLRTGTIARFTSRKPGEWRAAVHGTRPLWTHLQQAYEQWSQLGRPEPDAYQLKMTAQEASMVLGEVHFPLHWQDA